jgi:phosphoglycolate phosphatase
VKLSHLIFDVDGTLVNWKNGYVSVEDWVENVAKVVLKNYENELYGKFTVEHWHKIFEGEISRDIIPKEVWIELDKRDFIYRKELLKLGYAELFNDVYSLKGIGIEKSILSNSPTETINYTLEFFNIKDWFKIIQGKIYDHVDWCKPDPRQLLFVIKKLGLKPNEVAYVGDNCMDVDAANNAGCISIYINRKGEKHEKAKFNISSLYELRDLFLLNPNFGKKKL